jgi:hypothetical protein
MPSSPLTCGNAVQNPNINAGKMPGYSPALPNFVVILRSSCEIFHKKVTLSAPAIHSFTHKHYYLSLSTSSALSPKPTTPTTNTAIYLINYINNIWFSLKNSGGHLEKDGSLV